MANKAKKKFELKDVEVDTVGLVSMGANQETFFLLKSEDNVMTDDVQEIEQTTEEVVAPVVDEALLAAVREVVKSEIAAALKPAEPEAVEKSDEAPIEDDKFVALQKANQTLVERLEKAEKIAQDAQEAEEKREFLAKAKAFDALPAKVEELADQLRFIAKADPKRLEFWTGVLTATNALLKDGGIFAEVGSDQAPVDETEVQTLERVAKTGTPDEIKKALLSMTSESGQLYLKKRRATIKGAGD